MQRMHRVTDELITLYNIVGENTWEPSDIPLELQHNIRRWMTDGDIIRHTRGRSNTASKYTISQTLCKKIKADIILRENIGLYIAGQLSLTELARNSGLEVKYLNRRLIHIQRTVCEAEQGY